MTACLNAKPKRKKTIYGSCVHTPLHSHALQIFTYRYTQRNVGKALNYPSLFDYYNHPCLPEFLIKNCPIVANQLRT